MPKSYKNIEDSSDNDSSTSSNSSDRLCDEKEPGCKIMLDQINNFNNNIQKNRRKNPNNTSEFACNANEYSEECFGFYKKLHKMVNGSKHNKLKNDDHDYTNGRHDDSFDSECDTSINMLEGYLRGWGF